MRSADVFTWVGVISFIASFVVGIVMLAGFLLRLSVNWGVGAAKELRARRNEG